MASLLREHLADYIKSYFLKRRIRATRKGTNVNERCPGIEMRRSLKQQAALIKDVEAPIYSSTWDEDRKKAKRKWSYHLCEAFIQFSWV